MRDYGDNSVINYEHHTDEASANSLSLMDRDDGLMFDVDTVDNSLFMYGSPKLHVSEKKGYVFYSYFKDIKIMLNKELIALLDTVTLDMEFSFMSKGLRLYTILNYSHLGFLCLGLKIMEFNENLVSFLGLGLLFEALIVDKHIIAYRFDINLSSFTVILLNA